MNRFKNIISKIKLDSTTASSVKSVLIRPIGMILAVIYTPILLDYLGNEKYGVWISVLSIINWINACDLGIGNGLRNALTDSLANDDRENARRYVSTAYVVLTLISLVLMGVLILISMLLDWNIVLKTSLSVKPMLVVTSVFMSVNFVLALSNSILYAMHKPEYVGIRSCAVQVINITALLILRRYEAGNLLHMAILFGLSTSVVYLGNTVRIIKTDNCFHPKISLFSRDKVSTICVFGLQVFIIQLGGVFITFCQNFVVSYLYGVTEVTPLSTVNSAYAAVYAVFAALLSPIWSRTTDAIARGEFNWIHEAQKRVNKVAILFSAGFILISFFFVEISALWLGKRLEYQEGVIACTCIYYIVQVFNTSYSQFYFGMGNVKPLALITVLQVIIMIPLSNLLSATFGVAGVKLASSLLLLISGICLPFISNHRLSEIGKMYKKG